PLLLGVEAFFRGHLLGRLAGLAVLSPATTVAEALPQARQSGLSHHHDPGSIDRGHSVAPADRRARPGRGQAVSKAGERRDPDTGRFRSVLDVGAGHGAAFGAARNGLDSGAGAASSRGVGGQSVFSDPGVRYWTGHDPFQSLPGAD